MSLTDAMAAHARAAEWEQVGVLERRRRRALDEFFGAGVDGTDAEFVAGGIRALMAVDQEIMALCIGERDQIGEQAGALQRGSRAARAYDSNR